MPPKGADEGAMIEFFRLSLGSFAAPAASDFLDDQKVTKEPLGGGRNRQKRLRRPCLHAARPLEPPLRGSPLEAGKSLPARKTRSAWAPFRPAPLGA